MIARDLIEALKKLPPDKPVFILDSEEDGVWVVESVLEETIHVSLKQGYYYHSASDAVRDHMKGG